VLLEASAGPRARTRIDECETSREIAEQMGLAAIAHVLAPAEARR
jgi:hypothetical protein